jgi:hypothetical protein
MNYSKALKQMQMAYMGLTLGKINEDDQCIYCWKSGCGCESKTTAHNDSFINLTTVGEFKYA